MDYTQNKTPFGEPHVASTIPLQVTYVDIQKHFIPKMKPGKDKWVHGRGKAGKCIRWGTIKGKAGTFATLEKCWGKQNQKNKNVPIKECICGPSMNMFMRHSRTKKWYVVKALFNEHVTMYKILKKPDIDGVCILVRVCGRV
jgi:hypothetical protein